MASPCIPNTRRNDTPAAEAVNGVIHLPQRECEHRLHHLFWDLARHPALLAALANIGQVLNHVADVPAAKAFALLPLFRGKLALTSFLLNCRHIFCFWEPFQVPYTAHLPGVQGTELVIHVAWSWPFRLSSLLLSAGIVQQKVKKENPAGGRGSVLNTQHRDGAKALPPAPLSEGPTRGVVPRR